MQKLILFYKFTLIKDPEAIKLWQLSLCEKLNLRGRIIISRQGINGTLGGEINDIKRFIKETKNYPQFKSIDFKWSEGGPDDFPGLAVKLKPEIVNFGATDLIKVGKRGVKNTGKHLKPEQLHELISKYGDEVIMFDGRNDYESAVGKFKNAVLPNLKHSREYKKTIDSGKFDELKNKRVVTYCTGGVRCEVISALMKQSGFKHVYQLNGGIVKYGQHYKDDGLWEGKLFVFDGRLVTGFSPRAKDIGSCSVCKNATSNYINCATLSCNRLILLCSNCQSKKRRHCPDCVSIRAV